MNVWHQNETIFRQDFPSKEIKKLEKGVYLIGCDIKGFYLERKNDCFEFPYKIYGSQKKFSERVVSSFKNLDGNTGVLLNGIKGTGKTVTAKQIANLSELPVLIVANAFEGLPSFINSIEQEVCVFFDEFEKMYNDYDSSVLTVMDGILDNGHKRLFLLTTNKMHINENMISRPGRIRYLKMYNDLEAEVVKEIIDDLLENKEFEEACLKFISTLEIITIDIVKSVITEVNMYNESPEEFRDIFNVKKSVKTYNINSVDAAGKRKSVAKNAKIHPFYIDEDSIHDNFYINGQHKGEIVEIPESNLIVVRFENKETTFEIESNAKVHRNFAKVF